MFYFFQSTFDCCLENSLTYFRFPFSPFFHAPPRISNFPATPRPLARFLAHAQTLFEPVFIAFYNLFYTSQPVLALGVFDQDVSEDLSLKYPQLYFAGLHSVLFNKKEFFKSAVQGFCTSFVLFFATNGEFRALFFCSTEKCR